jgi:hypothetical protein
MPPTPILPIPFDESLHRRVARHAFSEGAIRLFVRFVLDAACSLRAASAAMRLLGSVIPAWEAGPAANTGQLWLLRIGLYELTRPKEAADDWVWIIDHTIQIGVQKCLVIVACRLSVWEANRRPLAHRDLQVLALEPVDRSDGKTVHRQLEQTRNITGIVPRQILSDEGTDLKGGIEAFCRQHTSTARSLDIAHQAANLLKRELEGDPRWTSFFGSCGQAKQRLAQTALAHLLPPTPRSKARYMNLDELVAWGRQTLGYLDHPHPIAGQPPDRAALCAKLGWLADYRQALEEWGQAMATISAVLNYIRTEGYHRGAAKLLRPIVAATAKTTMSRRLAARLLRFVRRQSATARGGERLTASTECLESLIGKGKRLEGQQSRSGFTKMLLGMAASVVDPTREYLTRALAEVRTADVLAWCHEKLGVSLQSQRQQALSLSGTNVG